MSQPEEAPAVSTLNNSSPASKGNESETLVTSGVPSIIIQDSFVIEKPSLSPSSSPSSRSSSSTTPVPRARTSNTKEALKDLDDDFPSVYTPSNRKEHEERVVVVAAPVTVSKGEQAEGDLERKQLATRMPPFFPPPSFPAGEPAPVPKPRRSPAPGLYEEEPVLPPVSVQPVPPPRKFFDNFLDNFIDTSPKNQFESVSGSESDQSDQSERHDVKPEVFERSNVLVLSSLDEESALDEDSVCDLLEKAIEEHDEPKNSGPIPFSSTTIIVNQSVEFKPPSQVSELFNGCEYDKSQQLESEFMIDSPPVGEKKENTVRALNIITSHGSATNSEDEAHEYSDGEPTVDFFNDQTVPISPVEKFEMESGSVLLPIGTPKETPVSKVIRRERLFSLMSTPNSEPDPDQVSADQHIQNTPVIDLNWLDGSPESDRSSHGFGGSDQLSSATSQAESAKTGDSAVFVSDIIDNSSRIDTTGTNPPDQPAETTPPANVSKQTTPASGASNKADMSWDMYDMRYVPTPPTSAVAAERKSLAPEVSAEGQFGRKRISLAPCLKTLELGTPTGNVSDATSPLPDIDDDDDDEAFADEQAGKQATILSLRRNTKETVETIPRQKNQPIKKPSTSPHVTYLATRPFL